MGTSFQPHIRRLVQAGIATHIVENAEAVDPLFALSKVRDFPQVTFAAVFEDGSVVLGCPEDLPSQIATIAQPIVVDDEPQPDTADDNSEEPNATASVNDSQLETLLATIKEQSLTTTALQEQLAQLHAELKESQSSIKAELPSETAFESLSAQLTQLQQHIENSSAPDLLSEMRDGLAALKSDIRTAASNQTQPDIGAKLETLEQHLADRVSSAVEQILGNHDTKDNEDFLHGLFGAFSDELKELITENAQKPSDPPALESALSSIVSRLEALTDVDQQVRQISLDLATVAKNVVQPAQPANNNLEEQVQNLANQLATLAERPDPVVDVTEQRQVLARFQTAMAAVLARLETEIAQVARHNETLRSSRTDLEGLSGQISALSDIRAPLADLQERMASVDARVEQLPKSQHTLLKAIEDIKQRPDPVLDLTEQRQSLAQFGNALGTVLKRLENVVVQLNGAGQQDDFTPHLTRIEDQIVDLRRGFEGADFAQAIVTQTDTLNDLRKEMAVALRQPQPPSDLAQQRTSFARFATMLGAIVARFEAIAEQFENERQANGRAQLDTPPQTEPTQSKSPFSDATVSFASLRMDFAELIAKHIMVNSQSADRDLPREGN